MKIRYLNSPGIEVSIGDSTELMWPGTYFTPVVTITSGNLPSLPYWDGPDRFVFEPDLPRLSIEGTIALPWPPEAAGRRILRIDHDVLYTVCAFVFAPES